MNDVNLDQVAVSLKERFPQCKEQIDKELARIRKQQQELANSGKRGESVHVLAMDFRAYIQNLPCAEYSPVKMKQRSAKRAKKRRLNKGRFTVVIRKALLESKGYTVLTATDGEAGIKLVRMHGAVSCSVGMFRTVASTPSNPTRLTGSCLST